MHANDVTEHSPLQTRDCLSLSEGSPNQSVIHSVFDASTPERGHQASFASATNFNGNSTVNPLVDPSTFNSMHSTVSTVNAYELRGAINTSSHKSNRPAASLSYTSLGQQRVRGSAPLPSNDRSFNSIPDPHFVPVPCANYGSPHMGHDIPPLMLPLDPSHAPDAWISQTPCVDLAPVSFASASLGAPVALSPAQQAPWSVSSATLSTSRHRLPSHDQNTAVALRRQRQDLRVKKSSSHPLTFHRKEKAPPSLNEAVYPPVLTRCLWGKCDVWLDDISPGGIERHIQAKHINGDWVRKHPGEWQLWQARSIVPFAIYNRDVRRMRKDLF
ncbi:hypothetical protein BKA93DRAFT_826764 [Sparassis latifolia]